MVECKNVKSEKVAKHLSSLTDHFKLWVHDNAVYAWFNIGSFPELKELGKKLKRIRNIEFRFIKIRNVTNHET